MNAARADSPVQKSSWTRWMAGIAVVFVAQVALIFIFGARKQVSPRPVQNAPSLALAGESSGDWLALNNATLFALPNLEGFAGPAWLEPPRVGEFRRQDWTEPPRWLLFSGAELGGAFNRFMQTNRFANVPLEFDLSPPLAAPVISAQTAFAQNSTLQIEGEIAERRLLNPMKLQSWPFADVIAPSVVQVLVDAAGDVVSAVLLSPENYSEAAPVRDPDADQRAIDLARAARFAPFAPDAEGMESDPASRLNVGQLIFNWQSVPPPATNGP